MNYCPILSTLGFILSPERKRILMVHRISRKTDDQFGKFNGLGGRVEREEDVATAMKREIREESGLECRKMSLRGTINWTGFGPNGEDWLAFIFLIEQTEGTAFTENEEGPLEWVEIEKIPDLPMWEGDRYFIPLVLDADPRPFHGFMPYKNGHPVDWSFVRM
ncbi:MAG: 8-oxo-dGTP diphosphatase [Verrucomicrobiota bacterium]|jgi:8-oxo-dGTP diphosphatase|nr:8-oxo-dGTP diphosphatase [Verrucomicrobiota bacterium]